MYVTSTEIIPSANKSTLPTMGRDFYYYLVPPLTIVEERERDEDGRRRERQEETLDFNVSRHNDVLGYIDPDHARSVNDLKNHIQKLSKELVDYATNDEEEDENRSDDLIEAIKVFSAVVMATRKRGRDTVWIHYG